MVLADSRKASPTPRYSGYPPEYTVYLYGTITPYGTSFQMLPIRCKFVMWVLQPLCCLNNIGLGSSLFARHYLGNHYIIFFSSAYLDVSVQRVDS